jgi:hypothetical protein
MQSKRKELNRDFTWMSDMPLLDRIETWKAVRNSLKNSTRPMVMMAPGFWAENLLNHTF